MSDIGKIQKREIVDEMRESYLDYAMSVIVARALPDVRDGLKPVHRRILYAMHEMGLGHDAKYRKSAAIVGDCLGKYHPHGDTSVYDAMVRMAQDFSMRYPLVDGQGNFGCFTGDTKVHLIDGRDISFFDLIAEAKRGKIHHTYTYNHDAGGVEIARVDAPRLTKKSAALVKVTLDNGSEIRCTPDHRFLLRDGAYREAKDLRLGDSLMPANIRMSTKEDDPNIVGYEMVYQPNHRRWDYAHHLADAWNLARNVYQSADGKIRHHADFNKRNNNPKNIVEQARQYNHKVLRVELLNEREDVYDLTIDGTHNFALAAGIFVHNSIDGDSPAAMRYTESRMTRVAEELLNDIEKDTVDFRDNYDATRKEPAVLPASVPNLLLNGTLGIAVGMATNIPPHNLGEVADATAALIDRPDTGNEELMEYVKGPDFPTGGIIFDEKEIRSAYAAGKGAVLTRGKAEIEEVHPIRSKSPSATADSPKANRTSNETQIVITEIPYQVNKSEMIEKMASLVQEKTIEGIRDIRDESDRDGMRIVIELKQDAHPQKVLNNLYKHTDLERTFHLNMLALVDGIQPRVLSLKDVLTEFIKHREIVVIRRAKFDLVRTRERIHILEGLKKALDHIDAVIAAIKKSEDREEAHANLVKKFDLSGIQASAILDMRLATLASLERQKIENELKEKTSLARALEALLKDPRKIREAVKKELLEIKDKYGDARKTAVVKSSPRAMTDEDLIADEDAVVVLTRGGYIKRVKPESWRVQKRGGKGIIGMETKEEDTVERLLTCTAHASLLFFTDTGKVYQVPAYEVPEGTRISKGKAIFNFLSIGQQERVTSVLAVPKKTKGVSHFIVMVTKEGVIKKVEADSFGAVRKNGLIAMSLHGGDVLRWAKLTSGKDEMILVSRRGQAIRFREQDIRPMGRTAAGVRSIRLGKGDEVVGMDVIENSKLKTQNSKLLVVMENGYGKQTALTQYKTQKRGGSGIKTAKVTPKTGAVVSAHIVAGEEEEMIAISRKGQVIRTGLAAIPSLSRSTQGVRIMRLEEGDSVASITTL